MSKKNDKFYINGIPVFTYEEDGQVCFRIGEDDITASTACISGDLTIEQRYRALVKFIADQVNDAGRINIRININGE